MGLIRETELGDEMELQFMCPSLMGFARWVIMFGDIATILYPEKLRQDVYTIAAGVQGKIEAASDTLEQPSASV